MFDSYIDLASAKESVKAIAVEIEKIGLPKISFDDYSSNYNKNTKNLDDHNTLDSRRSNHVDTSIRNMPQKSQCLIFAFSGNGNVSKGVRDIFELLPHEYITAEELPNIRKQVEMGERSDKKLYGIIVGLNDLVRLKSNGHAVGGINKTHYYAKPHLYESIFHR